MSKVFENIRLLSILPSQKRYKINKKFNMKHIILLLFCSFIITSLFSQSLSSHKEFQLISDDEIKERLSVIKNEVVKPRFDPAVRSYINTYTIKKRERTESMLGRTVIYYPLFERLLAENGLPTDLKYLSVVESALNAEAVSRSGAVGLWQFMLPTARECGLNVNSIVDERKDPEKATRAAIEYLARQFKRYNDWELALAAYNGGAGRVNRAIKRGRSNNFWKIRKYLPRETSAYVPAYIAAAYINHYYEEHNLNPVYPDVDFQMTELIKVYSTLTFKEIELITGTPEYVIQYLNPSYKRNYIPESENGHNLVLPQAKMAVFKNIYRAPDSGNRQYVVGEKLLIKSNNEHGSANSIQLNYNVEKGDEMSSLAKIFCCKQEDIMKWNKLTSSDLREGQKLVLFVSKQELNRLPSLEPIPLATSKLQSTKPIQTSDWKPLALPQAKSEKKNSKSRKWKRKHKIKRGDSLFSIAAQYEGVTVNDLIEWNNLKPGEPLKLKSKIKVKNY